MHPSGESTEKRVTRLEEHVGFVEHASDQLTKEMRELHRSIAALDKRMGLLERRLESVASPPEESTES